MHASSEGLRKDKGEDRDVKHDETAGAGDGNTGQNPKTHLLRRWLLTSETQVTEKKTGEEKRKRVKINNELLCT